MRERVQALVAIGRLQDLFAKMRKASGDVGSTGATVRKYESAFSNAARRGTTDAGSAGQSEPDDWFDRIDSSDDDSSADLDA